MAEVDERLGSSLDEDAEALARLRGGDRTAFDELFRRHVDAARRLARSMVRDPSAAEDAVADAFAQTLAAIDAGHGPVDGFDRYLRRSVRHQCLRTWRRQDRQRPTDDIVGAGGAPAEADGWDERLDRAVLREAFHALPPKMQRVLWQTEVESLDHRTVGRSLRMTPAAVGAAAMRARRELARHYLQRHVATTPGSGACAAVRSELSALVRDQASAVRRTELDEHLASCTGCASERDELVRVNARLRNAPLGALLELVGRRSLVTLVPRIGSLMGVTSGVASTVALVGLVVVAPTDAARSDEQGATGRQVVAAGPAVAETAPLMPATTLAPGAPTSSVSPSTTVTALPAVVTVPAPPVSGPPTSFDRATEPGDALVEPLRGVLAGTTAGLLGAVGGAVSGVVEGDLGEALDAVVSPVSSLVETVTAPLGTVAAPVAEVLSNVVDVVDDVVTDVVPVPAPAPMPTAAPTPPAPPPPTAPAPTRVDIELPVVGDLVDDVTSLLDG